MSATTVVIVAGISCILVSLAKLCRDLMIGRLISKLAAGATADQKSAICERLAGVLDSSGHGSEQENGDQGREGSLRGPSMSG